MRYAKNSVQICRAEVNVNKKRPETLFREQNSKAAGYKTLAGTALSSPDGTYMCHIAYQSSNLSNHYKLRLEIQFLLILTYCMT